MNLSIISGILETFYKHAHIAVLDIPKHRLSSLNYDDEFKSAVLEKYPHPLVEALLKDGNVLLGLLIGKLEGESDLFWDWLNFYGKVYSTSNFARIEDQLLERYDGLLNSWVGFIKQPKVDWKNI